MKPLLLAAAFVVAASPAWAAQAPAWTVDKAASKIAFSSSMNGDGFAGSFRRWDAVIRFDPANLAGSSVTATIDMASAVTGDEDRDSSLPGAEWFSAKTFPRATYTATKFRPAGPGKYIADGTLTMRGVSKPLSLPFSLAINGANARMSATINLNRLAFGVGSGEWKSTTVVPANVRVDLVVAARRAAK